MMIINVINGDYWLFNILSMIIILTNKILLSLIIILTNDNILIYWLYILLFNDE